MDRVCMCQLCYGPSLSWAEFVTSRVVQLGFSPTGFSSNKCGALRFMFGVPKYGKAALNSNPCYLLLKGWKG